MPLIVTRPTCHMRNAGPGARLRRREGQGAPGYADAGSGELGAVQAGTETGAFRSMLSAGGSATGVSAVPVK
jgi:hypothetical protein